MLDAESYDFAASYSIAIPLSSKKRLMRWFGAEPHFSVEFGACAFQHNLALLPTRIPTGLI